MLVQRLRRWPNIKPIKSRHLLLAIGHHTSRNNVHLSGEQYTPCTERPGTQNEHGYCGSFLYILNEELNSIPSGPCHRLHIGLLVLYMYSL